MKLTIYQKLLIFILPVVCFSILGVGYYSHFIAREEIVNEIRTKMERQAEDIAMEINRLFKQTSIDLITLSELTSIGDYYNNIEFELYNEAEVCRKSIERFMLDFSRRSKVYSEISFINGKGMEVSRIIRDQVGSRRKNLKDKSFLQEARRLQRGEIHISPMEMGDSSQGLILRHAIPIFNETGEFKGVVTLDLDFEKIQNMIGEIKIGKTGYALLINQEGLLLAHPESKRIFNPSVLNPSGVSQLKIIVDGMRAGKKGWAVYSTQNGDHLIGYASVGAPQWSVAVTAPFSDFMGRINQIKINSILAMFFIIVIATFGILIIARSLSHPIKNLVDYTRMVSNGNFDHQMSVTSKDEIGELTKSFNEMTAKLKSSQEEIERWNSELEERVRKTAGELKVEKEKLEGVFLSMADAVLVVDKFSKVVDINPAAERLLGTTKPHLVGYQVLVNSKIEEVRDPAIINLHLICAPRKPAQDFIKCWEYFHCKKNECPAFQSEEWRCWLLLGTLCDHSPQGLSEDKSGLKNCSSCPLFVQVRGKYKPIKQTEFQEVKLDLPSSTIKVFRTPMFDSQKRFIGMVFVLHDITKDKELDHMKSEFISTVSHELRTPLSSIKSFAELLSDDVGAMDIEIQRRFLGIITEESERLTRLISAILDLQKLEAKKMKFDMESIQLSLIIESCIHALSTLANEKSLNLSYECKDLLPMVRGDKDKLYQVFSNLISNAIKFSEKNGEIKIETGDTAEGVLITVSDKGLGIPADKIEEVFERFYQINDSPKNKRMGTGLGLAIVKEIIEQHGGRIWAESRLGEGSKFSFVIPKA